MRMSRQITGNQSRTSNNRHTIDISQPVPLNVEPVYTPENPTEEDYEIARRFHMPDFAADLVDFFFTEEDKKFILSVESETFSEEEVEPEYLADAFHRGVVNKKEGTEKTWCLNDFYGMLDVFSVSQTRKYRSLPREKRRRLDAWYFDSYARSLDADLTRRPTSDTILPLDEMLAYIDQEDRPLYLNYCDCKSLSGDCGLPSHTCINFVPGLNSFKARGLSRQVSKAEAKEVVRLSDEAGLVHTLSDHGICNCCDDCCYLFRAQRIRNSVGFWPRADYITVMQPEKCIGCGKCLKRCHFGAIQKKEEGRKMRISLNSALCEGCGLCVNTCPTGALSLERRKVTEFT